MGDTSAHLIGLLWVFIESTYEIISPEHGKHSKNIRHYLLYFVLKQGVN